MGVQVVSLLMPEGSMTFSRLRHEVRIVFYAGT